MKFILNKEKGFTLVEIMVVVAIIGMLSAVVYASFDDARAQSRDKIRMTSLKEAQLAIELYKAQNSKYPDACAGAGTTKFGGPGTATGNNVNCDPYILGLVPGFIAALPKDPKSESDSDKGFYYMSDGDSYKLMILDSVETATVAAGDEFARCPTAAGACASGIPANTYAVYSAGAENW